ncbi:MAG: hypothetical protein IJ783_03910, partial [Kiritimatiellae bacterium]|nr:hypothetical protein [Kiritimatiellia bacterium]
MSDAADLAIAAAAAEPLTARQRVALAVLARRAWAAQRKLGLAEEDFDAWRHAAVQDAAPHACGLSELAQG